MTEPLDVRAHEEGLARFLLPARRERFLAALGGRPKAREKELGRLAHSAGLDPASMTLLEPTGKADEQRRALEATVREAAGFEVGAVYVVSGDPSADGFVGPLPDALDLTVAGDFGSLISVVAGRLAVYEAEDIKTTYLLRLPAGRERR